MTIKIPYRINLAGAYLDCIDEQVVTSTIDKYLTFTFEKRDDEIIVVDSKEFPGLCITNLRPHGCEHSHWADYVNGCVFVLNDFNLTHGCNITVENDLPSGIGLSSSAAFIIGIIKCITYVNNLNLSDDLLANLGYSVEHDYLNIPCGRMDFKAVLHEPGLWKLDTRNSSLLSDNLLSIRHFTGLVLYKDQHEHLTDKRFTNIVMEIRDAKYNFKENLFSQYINFEKAIVACIAYDTKNEMYHVDYLGASLTQTYLNMVRNLFDKPCEYDKMIEGVYGYKLLGSGLTDSYFILINTDYEKELTNKFTEDGYTVVTVNL